MARFDLKLGVRLLVLGFLLAGCGSKGSERGSPTSSASSVAVMDPGSAAKEGFALFDKDPPDETGAVRLWEPACETGNDLACTGMGIAYTFGIGGKKQDYTKGLSLIEVGCAKGNQRGCAVLGQIRYFGWGTPKDIDQARTTWQKACDAGEPRGCYFLGVLYRAKDGPATWRDKDAGLVLLKKACDGSYRKACNEVELAAKERRVEQLRAKVKKKYWDSEPDSHCTGKGMPPYKWSYEGGTFAEDAEVARADGCTPAYGYAENTSFCCPAAP